MANISGSVSGTWDNHTEYTKNAVDSEHSAKVEAAKKGIVYCSKHVGTWTSRPKKGMVSSTTEVRDCPNCQDEHSLESKKRQLSHDAATKKIQAENAPPSPVYANPIHSVPQHQQQQQQHQHQQQQQYQQQQQQQQQQQFVPVAYGMTMATSGMAPIDRNKGYSSEWFECTNDVPVCCCTFCGCCVPFAICDIASRIHASSHGIAGVLTAMVSTVCWPCSLVCCAKNMMPCFITELVKKSMNAHGIGIAPAPCGEAEACCGCWWQVVCCGPCTLALIFREAKTKPIKR